MTNILWPVGAYNRGPFAQVQPFTYDDGFTVLDMLKMLRDYLNKHVIPGMESLKAYIDSEILRVESDFSGEVERLEKLIADTLQTIIDNSIEVQAPIVEELTGWVSVAMFGASGNGEDQTIAIAAATEHARQTGRGVWFPEGDYLITATINTNVSYRGAGKGRTKIHGMMTSQTLVRVGGGAVEAPIKLASNVAPGASLLQVVGEHSLSVGDRFILGDNTIPDRAYERTSGEMLQVSGISGNVISLVSPVRGTYVDTSAIQGYTVAEEAAIWPIDMVTGVSYSDFSLEGNINGYGGGGGLTLVGVEGFTVHNVEVSRLGGSGINVADCVDGSITDAHVHDLADDTVAGRYGYGVNIGGTTNNVKISRLLAERLRHGVTTNGGAIRGVPADVIVSDSIAKNTSNSGFDTHGAGINIQFLNCLSDTCLYGFSVRGKRVSLQNCKSVNAILDGLIFWGSRWAVVTDFVSQASTRYGINVESGVGVSLLNYFIDGAGGHGVRVINDAGRTEGILIRKGVVENNGLTSSSEGIYTTGNIPGLIIEDNLVGPTTGNVRSILTARNSENSIISGNRGIGLGFAGNPLMHVHSTARIRENYSLDNNTSDNKLSLSGYSTDRIESAASNLNMNKRAGMCVFNVTTRMPVWSSGSETTSVWVDATGATVHTPS